MSTPKEHLEETIKNAVVNFMDETGVIVDKITITWSQFNNYDVKVFSVDFEAR